jgi:hypothetical protein
VYSQPAFSINAAKKLKLLWQHFGHPHNMITMLVQIKEDEIRRACSIYGR